MKTKVCSLFIVSTFVCLLSAVSASRVFSKDVSFTPWISTATLKIFPDDMPPAGARAAFRLLAAKNEYEPFQVAVNAARDIKGLKVTISDLLGDNGTIPASKSALYLVENVTIERPSIAATRKVWPDPLPPYHDFDIKAGETRSVWVDLFVPADAKPGIYNGVSAVVSTGGESAALPISLEVRDITIPVKPSLKTAFGISYGGILEAHKIKPDDPAAQPLKEAYYWFLVEHRLSPYHIPVDFFSENAHRFLDDQRVTFLRAPMSRDKNEMRRIADRLKSTGWINKAVYYERDEPSSDIFAEVVEIGRWIHSFDPALKYLITTGYTPALKGADIAIWCPALIYTLDPVRMKGLRDEMARGKEFWWYTCIGPKWEGTDYFIDEGATSPKALTWMNLLYGVTGVLYWETTSWGSVDNNPWEKTETFPAGNGDGSLLYPGFEVGYNGPVASIRLKMLREGMEDYELLHILGEALRTAAGRIGGAASRYIPESRLFEHSFALLSPSGRGNPLGRNTPYLQFVSKDYRDFDAEREKVMDEIGRTLESPLLLVATNPVDNGFSNGGVARVKGYVEDGAKVTVNGKPVTVNDGTFKAEVPLQHGNNVIIIVATAGGSTKTLERVIYKK